MKRMRIFCGFIVGLLLCSTPAYSQAYTYYLPYYTSLSGYWTGVALRNCDSTKSANVNAYLYNNEGVNISTESKVIPSNGQTAFMTGEGLNKHGWIKIISTTQLVGLCFFGTTGSNNYMADISLIPELSTDLYVPHVAQSPLWDTTIMVCNPQNAATSVTLSFVNTSGTTLYIKDYYVPANGSKQCELKDLVQSTVQEQGSVEISSDTGVAAFALYKNLKTGSYSYAGISAASVGPIAGATVPGAPMIGTATAGGGQATVTFAAPSSNGGSPVTGYIVTSSPGGKTGTGTGSPITVSGLTNGTAYTFTVKAANAVGTGPASEASNSVTPKATVAIKPYNQVMTETLRGTWTFYYAVESFQYASTYYLNGEVMTNSASPGDYTITGYDQYGEIVAAGYISSQGGFGLTDPFATFIGIFAFNFTSANQVVGTYVQKQGVLWSRIYPMTGTRISTTSIGSGEILQRSQSTDIDELRKIDEADKMENAMLHPAIEPPSRDAIDEYNRLLEVIDAHKMKTINK